MLPNRKKSKQVVANYRGLSRQHSEKQFATTKQATKLNCRSNFGGDSNVTILSNRQQANSNKFSQILTSNSKLLII